MLVKSLCRAVGCVSVAILLLSVYICFASLTYCFYTINVSCQVGKMISEGTGPIYRSTKTGYNYVIDRIKYTKHHERKANSVTIKKGEYYNLKVLSTENSTIILGEILSDAQLFISDRYRKNRYPTEIKITIYGVHKMELEYLSEENDIISSVFAQHLSPPQWCDEYILKMVASEMRPL